MSSTSSSSEPVSTRHPNPVISFIIGLAIIIGASILNAAGLNLTKLDHVRTSAIPKALRKSDWMRPLWLLGMLLYILSQLIGSTLALEYMRAEYVAPLGSTSLVFNFLFARFLVGTPVRSTDIYGTVVVILGVIGIVAFGSINSGLISDSDVRRITSLWRRGGWLGYFFTMSFALFFVLIFTYRLDFVLSSRADLAAVPFSAARPTQGSVLPPPNISLPSTKRRRSWLGKILCIFIGLKAVWDTLINWVTDRLETWAAPKDDTQVAWTLGIGWACCGGGLAGGCLVFAKATVKLLSGSLSHENPGNQFGHAAPVFTIILLVLTSVLQIICLNRGLKVYDSTLVVPVFYGVYTATGWLNSLIFNNEVASYQSWTLFLIFVSVLVLISGVVLLTHKKPEPVIGKIKSTAGPRRRRRKADKGGKKIVDEQDEEGREIPVGGEGEVLWAVGEDEDEDDDDLFEDEDEDVDHHQHPLHQTLPTGRPAGAGTGSTTHLASRGARGGVSEHTGLVGRDDDDEDDEVLELGMMNHRRKDDNRRRSMDPFRDEQELDDYTSVVSSRSSGRPLR